MRLLEWLIAGVLLTALISVSLGASKSPVSLWMLLLLLAALLGAHAIFEGMHWQMAPIYLASLFLLPVTSHAFVAGRVDALLLIVCWTLLLSSLAASRALPMFKLMTPTGSYPVGTRMLYLTDLNREETHPGAPAGKREIVVQLWYPAAIAKGRRARYRLRKETKLLSSYQAVLRTQSIQDAPLAPGAFPVLIFNHAWGGFRNRSTFLTQELASHGFVVAAISHTYNASVTTLQGGRKVVPIDQVDIGFYAAAFVPVADRLRIADEELKIQVQDCIFVLDELAARNGTAADALHGRLRMDRVGAFGHSYGGAVSLEFAGEDARVLSALALDGVLHGESLHSGLRKPLMIIDSAWLAAAHGDEEDPDPVKRATAQLWALMQKAKKHCLAVSGGYELIVAGINHENFADVAFMSPIRRLSNAGPLPQRKAAAIISAYTVAFFEQTLLDRKSPLLSLGTSRFSEATMKFWPVVPTDSGCLAASDQDAGA